MSQHEGLNETRLKQESHRINLFRQLLLSRTSAVKIKLSVMEHINELNSGMSFGQDSLMKDTTRNATCYAMTDRVIAAVLTKHDYKRIL